MRARLEAVRARAAPRCSRSRSSSSRRAQLVGGAVHPVALLELARLARAARRSSSSSAHHADVEAGELEAVLAHPLERLAARRGPPSAGSESASSARSASSENSLLACRPSGCRRWTSRPRVARAVLALGLVELFERCRPSSRNSIAEASRGAASRRRRAAPRPRAAPAICVEARRGTRATASPATTSTFQPWSKRVDDRGQRLERHAARRTRACIARLRSSRTMSPSLRSPPAYSSSSLPSVELSSASRSEMRGTASRSPSAQRAPQRVGRERLVVRDRQAHRHARRLVHVGAASAPGT